MRPTRAELRDAIETIASLCDGAGESLNRCSELGVSHKTTVQEWLSWNGRIAEVAEEILDREDDDDDDQGDDDEPEEIFLRDDLMED